MAKKIDSKIFIDNLHSILIQNQQISHDDACDRFIELFKMSLECSKLKNLLYKKNKSKNVLQIKYDILAGKLHKCSRKDCGDIHLELGKFQKLIETSDNEMESIRKKLTLSRTNICDNIKYVTKNYKSIIFYTQDDVDIYKGNSIVYTFHKDNFYVLIFDSLSGYSKYPEFGNTDNVCNIFHKRILYSNSDIIQIGNYDASITSKNNIYEFDMYEFNDTLLCSIAPINMTNIHDYISIDLNTLNNVNGICEKGEKFDKIKDILNENFPQFYLTTFDKILNISILQ